MTHTRRWDITIKFSSQQNITAWDSFGFGSWELGAETVDCLTSLGLTASSVNPAMILQFPNKENFLSTNFLTKCMVRALSQHSYWRTAVGRKQSRYRPGVAQRVPGSWGSQISWQRHMKVVRLLALRKAEFNLRKYTWYTFLLEAEPTLGP